jgi:hypothetical protein
MRLWSAGTITFTGASAVSTTTTTSARSFFFTNTLEFVFAASDLIEAGWDIKAWSEIGTVMSHPFGAYRLTYTRNLEELKALLPASRTNRTSA